MLLAAAWLALGTAHAAPKVKIVGYINETSGCQTATIKHLKEFAARHPGDVSLEIVDFGRAAGRDRWHGDGYNCETIVINGANQFKAGSGTAARIVILKMPEGVRWTFPDLDAVLAQELRAPGSSPLSDAEARKLAQKMPVTWRKGRWNGRPVGEVVVGTQTVFRFVSSFGGKTAAQRAEAAAKQLKQLYAAGLSGDDIGVTAGETKEGLIGGIFARGKPVAVVTNAEAEIIRQKPMQAARFWAFNLGEALRILGR